MENFQRLTDKSEIISRLEELIMNREVYKELGEPLLFDDGDVWILNCKYNTVVAFICLNKLSRRLKYLYTKPRYRKNGYAKELLFEMDIVCIENLIGSIRLVSTNDGLNMYLKHGFKVTKSFKNYHNLIKRYEHIR